MSVPDVLLQIILLQEIHLTSHYQVYQLLLLMSSFIVLIAKERWNLICWRKRTLYWKIMLDIPRNVFAAVPSIQKN